MLSPGFSSLPLLHPLSQRRAGYRKQPLAEHRMSHIALLRVELFLCSGPVFLPQIDATTASCVGQDYRDDYEKSVLARGAANGWFVSNPAKATMISA